MRKNNEINATANSTDRPTLNNQVQVIDANAILSVSEISARAHKIVEKYEGLVRKGNKNVWDIATLVHNAVVSKSFKEDFGTMDILGEALHLGKASVSNMVKAVQCVSRVDRLDYTAWTMGQISELMRLDTEAINSLLDSNTVNCTMTTKEIRDAVKALSAPKTKPETKPETETNETNETTKTDVIKVLLNDKGEVTEMEIDETTRDKILSILLNYGVAKRVNAN